ncbi:hypothetical protein [Kushneria aurantia]|uniref:Uncharacterized protein n=1 Tax=Kushneria aurantia TaxID=504092 RepID=A0ABV6G4C8_9GAMM|nr:hypothetical protein [Kushneria aurantia]
MSDWQKLVGVGLMALTLPGGGRSPFILKQVRVREGGTTEVELSR